MEKYLGLPATPSSLQCPLSPHPQPPPPPWPRGRSPGLLFCRNYPNHQQCTIWTNKNEETVTSSRLSTAKIDRRGVSAPPWLLPASSTSLHPGNGPPLPPASRVGGTGTNFSNRTLPRWTERPRQEFPKPRYSIAPCLALAASGVGLREPSARCRLSPPSFSPPALIAGHPKVFAAHPLEYFQVVFQIVFNS